MKQLILATLILLALACSPSKHSAGAVGSQLPAPASQLDGSSAEKAIVIHANSETAGVSEEYRWLKKQYPGYTLKGQGLAPINGKSYDVLTITTADGVEKVVYFDITGFFGKL